MVEEKSLQIALEYIKAGKGKRTSGDLVRYMDSPDIEFEYRTTEVTTRSTIIPRLKQRDSIIIPKHRPGQKQYLIFNDKSEFDMIASMTDKIKSVIEAMDAPIKQLSVLRAGLRQKRNQRQKRQRVTAKVWVVCIIWKNSIWKIIV